MANLHKNFSKQIIIVVVLALFTNNALSIATHMTKESLVVPDAIYYYSFKQNKIAPILRRISETLNFVKPGSAYQITRLSRGGPDPRQPPSFVKPGGAYQITRLSPGGPDPRQPPSFVKVGGAYQITRLSPGGPDPRQPPSFVKSGGAYHITRLVPGGPNQEQPPNFVKPSDVYHITRTEGTNPSHHGFTKE